MSIDIKTKLQAHKNNYDNKVAELNKLKGRRDTLVPLISSTNTKILNMQQESQNAVMVQDVLEEVGKSSRGQAKAIFEKVVTDALQFAMQKNTKFIIEELGSRSKPAYEFYIEDETMGVMSKKPITSGGYMDICSSILGCAYYELFNDPSISNTSLLQDEPGKMVSNEIDIRFAEYIKFIGKQFNRHPIMITHKESLSVVADKYWYVDNVNGVATAREQYGMINIAQIQDETKGVFDNESEE